MIRRKKLALLCVTAMVVSSLFTACGKNEKSTKAETQTVQVTKVNGNTVTATVGTISEKKDEKGGSAPEGTPPAGKDDQGENAPEGTPPAGKDGQGGSAPEGTPPAGKDDQGENAPKGTPPAAKDSQGGSTSEGTPPAAKDGQDGNAPQGDFKGGGRSAFEAGEETITFELTDSTKITLEQLQGSADGTKDDIVENAILEVTLDKKNQATKIVVKNLHVGNGFGGSDEVTNGTAANTISTDETVSGKSYESTGDDENAVRVDGAKVTMTDATVNKSGGDSSNTENGDFYGANAGLLACNGANVTIDNASVTTNVVNGNGVFSYGEGTTVTISDSKIRTAKNNSGGIQTTGGATTNASNLEVETKGNSSAAIRSDRGGGTVVVDGGKYITNGTGSPAIYSTADITAKNATLKANSSEGIVVEGKNSVSLENCSVVSNMKNTYNDDSSENIHGIMIYQSMSGDADIGEADFSAKNGSITVKTGDLFYVTNTDCKISLETVDLTLANDTLLRIEGNSSSRGWGTEGANGGDVELTAKDQKLEGEIIVDKISSLDMTLSGTCSYKGQINTDGSAGTVKVTLKDNTTWTLTDDSYISEFSGNTSQIITNGHHVYVNGEKLV